MAIQYVILAAIGLNALAAAKRWSRDRSYPSAFMAIGSVSVVLGFFAVQFAGYSSAGITTASGELVLKPSAWEFPGRIALAFGLLLFSVGFVIDSFRVAKR